MILHNRDKGMLSTMEIKDVIQWGQKMVNS